MIDKETEMEKERKPARREKSIEEARPHNKGARLTLASAARAMAYNRGGGRHGRALAQAAANRAAFQPDQMQNTAPQGKIATHA